MEQAQQFYVRRGPMQYGPRTPEDVLDIDQVFSLRGERNDERLVRQGHVAQLSPNAKVAQCGQCGRRFISDASLEAHGIRWHGRKPTEEVVRDAVRASDAQVQREMASATRAGVSMDVTDAVGGEEDKAIARREKRLDEERPIFFDKTEASLRENTAGEVTTDPVAKAAAPKKARKRPQVRG